jgi:hypothetical protein
MSPRDGISDSISLGMPLGNSVGSFEGRPLGNSLGRVVGMLKDGLGEPLELALLSAGDFLSGESSLPEAIHTKTATTAATAATPTRRRKSGFRRLLGGSGGGCQPAWVGGSCPPPFP